MSKGREPVGHTCPDINAIQSRLESIISYCNDISYEAKQSISELESLRSANDALRSWGHDEAAEVDNLEDENLRQAEEIIDLNNRIKELEKQLENEQNNR